MTAPAGWCPFDESGRTVWRRDLADGTVIEVEFVDGLGSRWSHVIVDAHGDWNPDSDVLVSVWDYPDPVAAMKAADGYALYPVMVGGS